MAATHVAADGASATYLENNSRASAHLKSPKAIHEHCASDACLQVAALFGMCLLGYPVSIVIRRIVAFYLLSLAIVFVLMFTPKYLVSAHAVDGAQLWCEIQRALRSPSGTTGPVSKLCLGGEVLHKQHVSYDPCAGVFLLPARRSFHPLEPMVVSKTRGQTKIFSGLAAGCRFLERSCRCGCVWTYSLRPDSVSLVHYFKYWMARVLVSAQARAFSRLVETNRVPLRCTKFCVSWMGCFLINSAGRSGRQG